MEFLKTEMIVRIDAPMYFVGGIATLGIPPKYSKKTIFKDFSKTTILCFKQIYIEKGPGAQKIFFYAGEDQKR